MKGIGGPHEVRQVDVAAHAVETEHKPAPGPEIDDDFEHIEAGPPEAPFEFGEKASPQDLRSHFKTLRQGPVREEAHRVLGNEGFKLDVLANRSPAELDEIEKQVKELQQNQAKLWFNPAAAFSRVLGKDTLEKRMNDALTQISGARAKKNELDGQLQALFEGEPTADNLASASRLVADGANPNLVFKEATATGSVQLRALETLLSGTQSGTLRNRVLLEALKNVGPSATQEMLGKYKGEKAAGLYALAKLENPPTALLASLLKEGLPTATTDGRSIVNDLLQHPKSDDVIQNLTREGAYPHLLDSDGNTILHRWLQIPNQDIGGKIRALAQAGARPHIDLANSQGTTALETATFMRNRSAIEALVDSGADINRKNASGQSPLSQAAARKDQLAQKALLRTG